MSLSLEDLSNATCVVLRSECKKRDLPTDGRKSEIVKRLALAIESEKTTTPVVDEKPIVPEVGNQDENDSDDDIGPMKMFLEKKSTETEGLPAEEVSPVVDTPVTSTEPEVVKPILKNESYLLSDLPCAPMYEKSYTHPAVITHTITTPKTDFVYTASVNGSIKIWKKFPSGIEFVKHFYAHKARVTSLVSSFDGHYVASSGDDNTVKIYDVLTFDLLRIIKLDYTPGPTVWVYNTAIKSPLLAVSNSTTNEIYIYGEDDLIPLYTFKYHKATIAGIVYNLQKDYVVSLDKSGVFEYWRPLDGSIPKQEVEFKFKTLTDLTTLRNAKVTPLSLSISVQGSWMGVFGTDWKMYIFCVSTGKLHMVVDESEDTYKNLYVKQLLPVDSFHFSKKLKTEAAIRQKAEAGTLDSPMNCVFDRSDNFLLYCTLFGVKIINLVTKETKLTLGEVEHSTRFMNVSLFQGISKIPSQIRIGLKQTKKESAPEDIPDSPDITKKHFDGSQEDMSDPCVFVTAFDQRRFYIFSRHEPDESTEDRNVINEKEVAEDDILQEEGEAPKNFLAKRAILRTTMGDIELELWGNLAPKAVENFSTLSRDGYYENVIFHRVVKGFMIQTGDPSGSGFGGESMWHQPFEDELVKGLSFDVPFLLAMANAGRNTNGSQFFITTVPATWLNGKHTIFGKVLKGMNVVKDIERARVKKDSDRPFDDMKIVSVDTYMD